MLTCVIYRKKIHTPLKNVMLEVLAGRLVSGGEGGGQGFSRSENQDGDMRACTELQL